MRGPGDILPTAAARLGDKPALVTADRTLSYTELDELSARAAAGLAGLGVAPGDRVSLLSQNRWEWIVGYHAILRAGAVVNPLNVMLTAGEVSHSIADCQASVVLASPERAGELLDYRERVDSLRAIVSFGGGPPQTTPWEALLESEAVPPAPEPLDPRAMSTIGYTSGTTGRPKGAMQTHRAVLLNCALTATMHVRTDRDIVVSALPAPHVYGNVVINGTFIAGGTVVLMDRFDAAHALSLIEDHGATLFEGVPAMYSMLLAAPEIASADLRSITRSTVGGQTISTAVMAEWERRSGAPLLELWGMTELSGLGTTHALYAPNVQGSIGTALPGVEVRTASLTDPTRPAAVGEPGELVVRGPIISMGYWGNEAATRDLIDDDGWLHSGDVAEVDEGRHFYIVDRLKDTILTSGYNVYPAEIERVIAELPAVAMAAVGRVPNEVKGELARAYIVLKPDAELDAEEVIAHCRRELAAYKLPRSVTFVGDLPRTSSGKIIRRELHTLDVPAHASPGQSPPDHVPVAESRT